MLQGVGGHRARQGVWREGRLWHSSGPHCCPHSKAARDFSAFIPAVPTILVPIVTEQPALQRSVTSLVPRQEVQTCEAQAIPQHLGRHTSQGQLSCTSECDEHLLCLCSPGKTNELLADGMAQPGWPGSARSLPKARDGW